MPDRPGDMDERDVDARFASIVARWDGPVPDADDAASDVEAAASRRPPTRRPHARRRRVRRPVRPPTGEHATAEPHADADPPERDAGEPAAAARPPRSPWVNPSPLDVVVPPSAWRAAEPDAATAEAAAAAEEAALRTSTSSRPRWCSPRRRTCTSGVPSSAWSPARSCCSTSCSPARPTARAGSSSSVRRLARRLRAARPAPADTPRPHERRRRRPRLTASARRSPRHADAAPHVRVSVDAIGPRISTARAARRRGRPRWARWSLARRTRHPGRSTSRCGSTRSSGEANTTSSRRRGARAGNVGRSGETSRSRSGTSMSRQAPPVWSSLRSPASTSGPRSGDRLEDPLGVRDPLGRLEAEVHRHGRQLAAARQRRPAPRHTPGAVGPAHRQPQVLGTPRPAPGRR